MPNYENFFVYEYWQFEVIRHTFAFTAAVFAAALVYFALSAFSVRQSWRLTSFISAVVMVSATLELGNIWITWSNTFDVAIAPEAVLAAATAGTAAAGTVPLVTEEAVAQVARVPGQVFSNGYRYANWMIDVPMLLTQFLIVLGFTARDFGRRWAALFSLGWSMIILGYIGQYYEPQVAGFVEGSGIGFWIWGGLSWLAFFALLYFANDAYKTGLPFLTPRAQETMRLAWYTLLVSWFLYGFVYLIPGIPVINDSATWVMIRQILYSFCDITSKVVFGVMLARVAQIMSKETEKDVQQVG